MVHFEFVKLCAFHVVVLRVWMDHIHQVGIRNERDTKNIKFVLHKWSYSLCDLVSLAVDPSGIWAFKIHHFGLSCEIFNGGNVARVMRFVLIVVLRLSRLRVRHKPRRAHLIRWTRPNSHFFVLINLWQSAAGWARYWRRLLSSPQKQRRRRYHHVIGCVRLGVYFVCWCVCVNKSVSSSGSSSRGATIFRPAAVRNMCAMPSRQPPPDNRIIDV